MALLWQKGKKGADIKAEKPEKKAAAKAPKAPKAEKKVATKAVAVKEATSKNEKRAAAAAGIVFPKGGAVIRPRVTEKAGLLSQNGIYTFDVQVSASSSSIAKAIADAYKVTVTAVRVAPIKGKKVFARGRKGKTAAGKKAYVTLKEGDKIEFI